MSDERDRPHHVKCGRELSRVRGEWYCLKCWCTVELPMLSQAEAAKEASAVRDSARGIQPVPWTEEERRTWDTWKEGDPVPGETRRMEPEETSIKVLNTNALGKSCIETLRYHQEQLAVLESKATKIREEAAKLVAIAQLAGVEVPAELVAMSKKEFAGGRRSNAGAKPGSRASLFACPDCGHTTSNKFKRRHIDTCPKRVAA